MSGRWLGRAKDALAAGHSDEAVAAALISIGQSLASLQAVAVARHGVCVDCGHPWKVHERTSPDGCQATVITHGKAVCCPCTEPRPTP